MATPGKTTYTFQKKVGDKASWTTRGIPYVGTILALIPAGESAQKALAAAKPGVDAAKSIKTYDISQRPRYLIEVLAGKKRTVSRYYLPQAGSIDGKAAAA